MRIRSVTATELSPGSYITQGVKKNKNILHSLNLDRSSSQPNRGNFSTEICLSIVVTLVLIFQIVNDNNIRSDPQDQSNWEDGDARDKDR